MRYLIQLLIPALILIGVVYLVTRTRRTGSDTEGATGDGEKGTFIVILVIGALAAVAIVFALFGQGVGQGVGEGG